MVEEEAGERLRHRDDRAAPAARPPPPRGCCGGWRCRSPPGPGGARGGRGRTPRRGGCRPARAGCSSGDRGGRRCRGRDGPALAAGRRAEPSPYHRSPCSRCRAWKMFTGVEFLVFRGRECSIPGAFIHTRRRSRPYATSHEDRHFGTLRRPFGRPASAAGRRASRRPRSPSRSRMSGTVPKGDKIVHDFVIKNEGDADLEITNVQPACGCTVAEFDKTISPGQTGKVHAVVDTATFSGPISKGVTRLHQRSRQPADRADGPGQGRALHLGQARATPATSRSRASRRRGTSARPLWAPDGASLDITERRVAVPFLKVTYREAKPEERLPDAKGKQWRVEMKLVERRQGGAAGGLRDASTPTTRSRSSCRSRSPASCGR